MTKVYLAQSVHDYGSEYAEAAKREICGIYDVKVDDIVDQADYDVDRNAGKGVFFPLIRRCDVFWYLPRWDSGEITDNVRTQLDYAKRMNMEIEDGRSMTNKWW